MLKRTSPMERRLTEWKLGVERLWQAAATGRRLSAPEIHQACTRVARAAHSGGGGNAAKFQALAAARDALMKQR
jgi:hypothetical protein